MSSRPIVLAVDDEQMNLKTIVRVFRRELDIACAASGVAALALVEQRAFDVALIDYSMPGMTGVELAGRIRRRRPEMGLILVTAHVGVVEVDAARSEGLVAAVVLKPWDKEELLQWIQRVRRVPAAPRP